MWFKNISPFRIDMHGITAATVSEELAQYPLTEPVDALGGEMEDAK